ncbi:glycerol acyltransferase [Pleurocapsa sp. CCALA 161]|uniref:lysophospholipid acyltransferase family protein n=1 Tax=Pleurocapsa sp. CCALA 161 TaxID=2107688 RepID=UPI000D056E8D|nr:lysophospholipid acyltransferase family protein [Pleurocapsa sp. CCALA 161]PSB11691.1 glycerol acyltransferase [Pleurocapsa sp. CCALA 161]
MNYRQTQDPVSTIKSAKVLAELFLKASVANVNTLTGWSLDDRNPQIIEQLMPFVSWLYHNYFRVQTDGWENIPPTGKVLLIGSHNGGLAAPDTVMMTYDWFRQFGTDRLAYALMEPKVWQALPGLARLAAQVGAIQPHPDLVRAALRRDAAVLIYPGGAKDVFRPHSMRNKIYFHGHKGFIKLALQEKAPIVPFISHGAHSTLIVLADIYPQVQQLHKWGMPWLGGFDPGVFPIYLGLPWGLGVGPLPNIPLPIPLHTRVCSPILFERYGQEASRDREYVEQCYDRVCQQMQQQLDQLVQEKER